MKKTSLIILIFCALNVIVTAQSVVINEDPTITRMLSKMTEINNSDRGIDGWRVQILATTDRRKMEAAKTTFQRDYPQVIIDWVHEKPYYKLRVGAFATKLEAARLLYDLKKDYGSAYPAKDHNIRPSELLGL